MLLYVLCKINFGFFNVYILISLKVALYFSIMHKLSVAQLTDVRPNLTSTLPWKRANSMARLRILHDQDYFLALEEQLYDWVPESCQRDCRVTWQAIPFQSRKVIKDLMPKFSDGRPTSVQLKCHSVILLLDQIGTHF